MSRIKIEDLSKDREISKEEMKKISGGNPLSVFNRLSNPWILSSLVASAIAIPVAIHDADDEPSS